MQVPPQSFFLHPMHKGLGALQESVNNLGLEREEGLAIHVWKK